MTATHTLPAAGSAPAGITSAGAPVRIGGVALTVRDLETVSRFYREAIGLSVVDSGAGLARLGAGGKVLLELRHDPEAPLAERRQAGLFHTAFLLPDRASLAGWLVQAAERGVRLEGASDHLVSEALYLSDPEGNGIEIYRDRPSESWGVEGGMIRMATERLDLRALADDAPKGGWHGAPDGTVVGHVHLQVGDLSATEPFWSGLLGLGLVCRYPGANFFGAGGYHHHVGTNVWNSRGAGPRPARSTGLAEVSLVGRPAAVAAVRGRLPEAARSAGPLALRDPWGTPVTLTEG